MPSKDSKRPSIRKIAALAGVSSTAVSLALRGHPKISEKTRTRIRAVAAKLGYRPDPYVAKLMYHLQTRDKRSFQATLCALTTQTAGRHFDYAAAMKKSAQQRADSLGYKLSVMHIEENPGPRADLQRILTNRGIEGILLLPMGAPGEFTHLLDWGKFSVVSATYGVLAPRFHRVVPHQFSNTMLLCRTLAARGYRRIGLVLHAKHDLRVHHSFSAAVSWQNLLGGTELVRPLIYEGAEPPDLERWFKAEAPDAIVSAGATDERAIMERLGLSVPGPVGFAITAINPAVPSEIAGIEERPAEIGARAIELLASMVQRGERGIPAVPTVTMIEGGWIEGPSVRSAPGIPVVRVPETTPSHMRSPSGVYPRKAQRSPSA